MAWTYDELEFPKQPTCSVDVVGNTTLPMLLDDEDDDGNPFTHPLPALIREGKQIEAVSVEEEWSDDRCPCLNMIVTVEGKKYGFAAWWLSREGYKMCIRAESMSEKAIADLREYIMNP